MQLRPGACGIDVLGQGKQCCFQHLQTRHPAALVIGRVDPALEKPDSALGRFEGARGTREQCLLQVHALQLLPLSGLVLAVLHEGDIEQGVVGRLLPRGSGPEASDEAARSRRLLHMLHEMRMLFLADVERWALGP